MNRESGAFVEQVLQFYPEYAVRRAEFGCAYASFTSLLVRALREYGMDMPGFKA